MATIRKRKDKWQVQVRRIGHRPFSKTFNVKKDALAWARQSEVEADRAELPTDPKALQTVTLGELVRRYRDTVSVKKRAYENERVSLNAFLSHQICARRLSDLRTEDFAAFRDDRLKTVKPVSLKRQLDPIHNLFEIAKHEWGLASERCVLPTSVKENLKFLVKIRNAVAHRLTGNIDLKIASKLQASALNFNTWLTFLPASYPCGSMHAPLIWDV